MSALPFTWDGEVMAPARGFARQADATFIVGERYRLVVVEERSAKSHAHYFASISEAWSTLPEDQAERFPSPDHLRRWALIRAGFHERREIVCASKAEAQRVAAFVRPMDSYAVVIAREAVVTVLTARSQSVKAMGKADFQRSKQAVLDVLAEVLGVEARQIEDARAA